MAEIAVADASPLIVLSRSGLLDFLRLVAEVIIVTATVAAEVRRRGPEDPTARALQETSWLRVVEAPPIPEVIQAWELEPGESSVLAWAHANAGVEAIVDDLRGRRCAAALGIPVRGTVGVVLLAKQHGLILAARPVLTELRRAGLYLSDRVMDEALALVGEGQHGR